LTGDLYRTLREAAEGVETKDQAEFLSDCGCDIAQGFYYAKPMPLEDFNKKMEMA
jgi:EAL domain-containing protein (putative c-di-GMP-specific phosphodiesterase class I)